MKNRTIAFLCALLCSFGCRCYPVIASLSREAAKARNGKRQPVKSRAKVSAKATQATPKPEDKHALLVWATQQKPRVPLETMLDFRNMSPEAPSGTVVVLSGFLTFAKVKEGATQPNAIKTSLIKLGE